MTLVELDRSPGKYPNAAARQEAARAYYLAAMADGRQLNGDQLGRHFGRSGRWGRERIAEASADPPAGAVADDEGSDPAPVGRPWWAWLVTGLVAVVAAAASYGHMHEVAERAGEPVLIALAVPATVDGLVLAALGKGKGGAWWLRLGLAVSVAANLAAAEPTWLGRAVAAWPPVALLGTHRLLHGDR